MNPRLQLVMMVSFMFIIELSDLQLKLSTVMEDKH